MSLYIILHTVLKESTPGAGIKSGLGWNLRRFLKRRSAREHDLGVITLVSRPFAIV